MRASSIQRLQYTQSVISKRVGQVALLIAVIVAVLAVRHYFSPGEVVRRQLIATVDAFEDERMLAVMSSISRSYSDPWGLDYEMLAGHLHEVMETYDDLRVDLVLDKPEVAADEVRIGLRFILWGSYEGTLGYVVGSLSAPCSAVLVWRKEQPGWRLTSIAELEIPELQRELDARRMNR
jgi:hypothetical protein